MVVVRWFSGMSHVCDGPHAKRRLLNWERGKIILTSFALQQSWHVIDEKWTHIRIRIRIFNGLEKGTYAPNNHEQAFVQREETKD